MSLVQNPGSKRVKEIEPTIQFAIKKNKYKSLLNIKSIAFKNNLHISLWK